MEKVLTQEDIRIFLSNKLIEISNEFKNNNITWWAKGGTIIGAIYHGDIIPWDDDIDMGMELSVYLKNKDLIQEIVRKFGFTLFDKYSKEGKGLTHLKLIYEEKFIVEFNDYKYQFRPFVDIMLASSVKKESKKELITWKFSNHFKHIYSSWISPFPRYGYDIKKGRSIRKRLFTTILILPFVFIIRILIPSFVFRKIMFKIDSKREEKNKDSKFVAYNYAFMKPERNLLLQREVKWVKFGKGELPINIDYEKELSFVYGKVVVPSIEQQHPSHYTVVPLKYKKGKAKLSPYSFK